MKDSSRYGFWSSDRHQIFYENSFCDSLLLII